MIDPQSQANFWIKNMEEGHLILLDPLSDKVLEVIKKAVADGLAILYQNVDNDLDPVLDGILAKNIRKMPNGKSLIHLGGQDVGYNPDFRFYITSKQSNPTYKPEVSTKVTIVNFSVKPKGLEEQLLAVLLKIMDPKLEQQRQECITTKANCDGTLRHLEDEI
jgi:dynein heavy chain